MNNHYHPRLKSCFFPVPHHSVIQLGLTHGRAVEITNPNRQAEYLISLLDGSHSLEDVMLAFFRKYPAVLKVSILSMMKRLIKYGMIEDAKIVGVQDPPHHFSQVELERYSRQISFFVYSLKDLSHH